VRERPLWPHLSVYRFMYTMVLSILPLFTGLALDFGLCALVYWL
jgi:succinate dehydrogenase / fumarate reductase cytochrome b subunit